MIEIFSILLLLFWSSANCQKLQIDSLTYDNTQYKDSSKLFSFDLGKINLYNTYVQKFNLHITNNSDTTIYLESLMTADYMVGDTPREPILSGRSSSIPFSFQIKILGNKTRSITIGYRYSNSSNIEFLYFQVKYEIVENTVGNNKIFGIVTDKKMGVPFPSVTVRIDKTNKGSQTDLEGRYSIIAKLNDTLVFSSVGMKTQRIKADKKEIDVALVESEPLPEMIVPPYPSIVKRKLDATKVVTVKDVKNVNNPEYNFKKNAKNNVFIIFVSELTSYDFSKDDREFQQKYNVKYSLMGSYKIDYLTKYNKLTFNHLNIKYKKSWMIEIRKDAIGLEKE